MGKHVVSNARERVLVDGDWLQARLGQRGLVICEVDERPAIYRIGHVPGAHCLDWRFDLQDPLSRDIPGPEAIRRLWRRLGVTKRSTVVFYGDKSNWYACFGFWLFRLYGLEDLRLLDGGRQAWVAEGRPLSQKEPTEPRRSDTRKPGGGGGGPGAAAPTPAVRLRPLRAHWRDVDAAMRDGVQLLDVRTPAEYRGDLLTEPGYPEEGAQRAGHIPGALSVPWDLAVAGDGRILDDERLRERFRERGVDLRAPAITYCRIGERSAHTWFVLHELLGASARNYDGSWTEWGSMIGMPVAVGDEPGRLKS
jgi:thiosulfate/3-mercaptopyruvate sulfurtransferase